MNRLHAALWTKRSTMVSPSLIPLMPIHLAGLWRAWAAPKNISATGSRGNVNRLCWRPSSFSRWAPVPMIVVGRASISSRRLRLACAVDQLKRLCDERQVPVAQVALAWVLAQPAITSAIVGASKAEQLDQSLPAVDLTLDEQLLAACDDIWYQLPRERSKDIALR